MLLGLCRTSLYYTESEETAENLEIMRPLDRQYAITPFYGQRRLQAWLAENGYPVNIKRLRRLMELVRWRTLFPEHRTTVADKKAYKDTCEPLSPPKRGGLTHKEKKHYRMRNNLYICNANPQTKTTLISHICGSNFGTHYTILFFIFSSIMSNSFFSKDNDFSAILLLLF